MAPSSWRALVLPSGTGSSRSVAALPVASVPADAPVRCLTPELARRATAARHETHDPGARDGGASVDGGAAAPGSKAGGPRVSLPSEPW